jgi:hypothetical protein
MAKHSVEQMADSRAALSVVKWAQHSAGQKVGYWVAQTALPMVLPMAAATAALSVDWTAVLMADWKVAHWAE